MGGNIFGGGAKTAFANNLAAQQGIAQQAAANREAAIAGAEISMINQTTPYGSLTYSQTGKSENNNPIYTATQTFDPDTQRALDSSKRLDYKTNEASEGLIDRAQAGILGQNLDISDNAIAAKVQGMINPRLQRRFDQEETRLKDGLIQRGLREGSQAFSDAVRSFNEGKNDAYAQEALSNRQQAIQEIVLPRNQLINETTGLAGMQQIGQPQFVSTPRTSIQPADYGQLTSTIINGNNNMQSQRRANVGDIAGLVGQGLQLGATLLSDERAKTDMKKVGELDNGQKVYAYRYLGGGPMQIGLKAQDVEKDMPDAVAEGADGMKRVNYALAVARKNGKEKRYAA
jgi:hypothetical protein